MNDSLTKLLAYIEPIILNIQDNRMEVKALKSVYESIKELIELGQNSYLDILEYYDNVTYNIRFYMINHVYQKKLSIDRQKGIIPNNYQLPDESKIIIAETGISSNYDITSLTINTIHNSVSNNPSIISYKMDMKLKEINGCSLINKITAISKLIGYESYVLQPYHVDIWFSGYEQSSGKPIRVINNEVLTYEVLLSEVKTNIDVSGTMYNFIMTSVPPSTFNKSVNSLYNIGNIDSTAWAGGIAGYTQTRDLEGNISNNCEISLCYNKGNVTTNGSNQSSSNVGGIMGLHKLYTPVFITGIIPPSTRYPPW